MDKLKKLMEMNGVKSLKKEDNTKERVEELERIIQEQDEALMELAELIIGGIG